MLDIFGFHTVWAEDGTVLNQAGEVVPNQHEVRWSQLKVGVLVIVAIATLTALISLMSGSTGGLFTRRIVVHSYFENASGLKPGAPVNLQGVTVGTVEKILIVPRRKLTPVEVVMKLGLKYSDGLHKDSLASLSTAGVLGDTFVDIDSSHANGPPLKNGDELSTTETPSLSDVIKSSQSTIEQVNVILAKMNTLADTLGTTKGSAGKFLNDPGLYDNAVGTLKQAQSLVQQVNAGKGTLGKLITDPSLYNRANDTVTRLQKIADQIDAGQGTIGKLVKDDALYNNLNHTVANANTLISQVNAGKGTLGMLTQDEAFRNKVNLAITNLQAILHRADEGQGTVGKLLHDPALYDNSNQTIVEMRKLVAAIRQNPKKYLVIRLRIF
jgi:phospholipid/cholesterol/gamma-HCH transport system substrate-binding protein